MSLSSLKTKVCDLTTAVTNGYTAMTKVSDDDFLKFMISFWCIEFVFFVLQQLLQSQACLRHMELRISNLEKLQASYDVHLKMKDGIQNMYEAYKNSPGNQYKNLSNIKTGWKDCIQVYLTKSQTNLIKAWLNFVKLS